MEVITCKWITLSKLMVGRNVRKYIPNILTGQNYCEVSKYIEYISQLYIKYIVGEVHMLHICHKYIPNISADQICRDSRGAQGM